MFFRRYFKDFMGSNRRFKNGCTSQTPDKNFFLQIPGTVSVLLTEFLLMGLRCLYFSKFPQLLLRLLIQHFLVHQHLGTTSLDDSHLFPSRFYNPDTGRKPDNLYKGYNLYFIVA